ncbi:hypothetical protein HK104_009916 [Borealophlyctis nickersoniae]|nr:hypothetical protein HK104_009916 [Borealophlyctis nickersoniae]
MSHDTMNTNSEISNPDTTTELKHDGTLFDLDGVPNFRDAGENKVTKDGRRLKPRVVFRSATTDEASEDDVRYITEELGIRTIIDLRSRGEGIHRAQHALEGSPTLADRYKLSEMARPAGENRVTFKIDFMLTLRRYIWSSLDFVTKVLFIILTIFFQHNTARRLVVSRSFLSRSGLYGMNRAILTNCGKDIQRIFTILADKSSYPVLIHCTAGKDRTGLTVALLQMLAGVESDQIIRDYARSKEGLKSQMGRLVEGVGQHGLSDDFAGCPPEVMEKTLLFIKEEYGSIEQYLESVGVERDVQERVRTNLLLQE